MEKECFIQTMDALLPEIHITEVVTDAHPQITALLGKENGCKIYILDVQMNVFVILKASPSTDLKHGKYKAWGLQHSLDIWHAAKNLGKKLRRVSSFTAL